MKFGDERRDETNRGSPQWHTPQKYPEILAYQELLRLPDSWKDAQLVSSTGGKVLSRGVVGGQKIELIKVW